MKIVFFGNCQAGALRALFDTYVRPHTGDESSLIASYVKLSDAHQALISTADMLVVQTQDFSTKAKPLPFPPHIPVHRFPVVGGGFLWPYGGRDRPGNARVPGLPSGPWPFQLGDSYLNRLLRDGVDVEVAFRRYMDLDIAQEVDLDRLFGLTIAKQKRLDRGLGFDTASIIEEHLRQEQLFATAYHPEPRILKHLAATVFGRMGVDTGIIRRMERWQSESILPPSENPIHPSVATHFGLTWVTHDRKYRFHNEGRFSFEESVQRYLSGTWNPLLCLGMAYTNQKRPPEEAREVLERALAISADSGPGWLALSTNLRRMNRLDEAIAAARVAVERDPAISRAHAHLGNLLNDAGDHQGAVSALRAAYALDPANRSVQRILPVALRRSGDVPGAIAFIREQLADPIDPPTSSMIVQLADLEAQVGNVEESLRLADQAAMMRPIQVATLVTLSDLLARLKRSDAAIRFLHQAIAIQPDADHAWYNLARLLHQSGDDEAAVLACQRAIDLNPSQRLHHDQMYRILIRLKRFDDARAACEAALGSRLNQVHQMASDTSMTVAWKFRASLSYRVAALLQSLRRENARSTMFRPL